MKLFYLSLTRSLLGFYVAFLAPDESVVREHAAKYFGRMWCSVYTEDPSNFKGTIEVLRKDNPIVLNSPDWE